MNKRLITLNGLAILAVVVNHAAAWGQIAMILWTHRYRPVAVPNYDQVGTPAYYVFLVIRQLTNFSVPAFLFICGLFIAYALRERSLPASWKIVRARLIGLLAPYLVWSSVAFAGDALQGIYYPVLGYLGLLVSQGAVGLFYFVPLLCYLYLLSPFVIAFAKLRPGLLLLVTAAIQLVTIAVNTLSLYRVDVPGLQQMLILTPTWSLPRWAFFFALGLVISFHAERVQHWLRRYKWSILLATVALAVLNVAEAELIYRLKRPLWYPYAGIGTLSYNLYGVAFILCYLAFSGVSLPFSRALYQLGTRSYGIYLLHYLLMTLVAKVIYRFVPWLLGQQLLYQPILLVVGFGGVLLLMATVSRSPMRRYYRFLFG